MSTSLPLIERVQTALLGASSFVKTGNYYFENHDCHGQYGDGGGVENLRVMLDFEARDEGCDEVVRFGRCERCGAVFYNSFRGGKNHL